MNKIYLASDHAGMELKSWIAKHLAELPNIEYVEDCGNFKEEPDDDYPDWISKAAEKVSKESGSMGIVFGKSGEGEAIVANKFKNIRAVVGFNVENVKLTREDNDANILCLGSRFIDHLLAEQLVDAFINTPFSDEKRHIRRINKIKAFER